MTKLAIVFGDDGKIDRADAFARAVAADEEGVDALFVGEPNGADAFVVMTQLAERTRRARIGSYVVSIFARSAAQTAQGFVSLDIASQGRVIAGIGVGAPQLAQSWHGVPFEQPLKRLGDYVAAMRLIFEGKPLVLHGEVLHFDAPGVKLRERAVQSRIPIAIGSMAPQSVRLTASLADMWFPQTIPMSRLKIEIDAFRDAVARAGRAPDAVEVKSPGAVFAARRGIEEIQFERAKYNAYVLRGLKAARLQMERAGRAEFLARLDEAWLSGGVDAGARVTLDDLGDEIDFVGTPQACAARIAEQSRAGVDLHAVQISACDMCEFREILRELL